VVLLGRRTMSAAPEQRGPVRLLSRTECLPNSILEAMAAGLPIVCTRVAGCRDLVRHMQSGLLVEPQSPDAIARGSTCS